jgi:hypothetical protein
MVSHRRPIVFTFDCRAQRKNTKAVPDCSEIEQNCKRLPIIDFALAFPSFSPFAYALSRVI